MIALNADTYVTGHGDLMTKEDVKKKLAFIQDQWDKIKAMVAQGKSLDDVKTSMGESTAPPVPNAQGNMPAATLPRSCTTKCQRREADALPFLNFPGCRPDAGPSIRTTKPACANRAASRFQVATTFSSRPFYLRSLRRCTRKRAIVYYRPVNN